MIIDITSEVYTNIKSTLVNQATVLASYPSVTPTFPLVTIEEMTNTIHVETVDTAGENHNDVSIEVNIFSESQNKISEVKSIRDSIDSIMSGQYKMNRVFAGTTPNFLDTNVYKYTLRYSFVIDENRMIYRG